MMTEHKQNIDLIAISYAKGLLRAESQERERAQKYAEALASYHVIVFTKKSEGFETQRFGEQFVVHPTNSRCRLLMLYDAYRIGRSILQNNTNTQYIVSSQDPFESSLVGRLLARASNAVHHVQLHESAYGTVEWRRESLMNRCRYWFGLFVLKRATCIRVGSKRLRRALRARGIPEERITVLPIRSDLDTYLAIDRRNVEEDVPEAHKKVTILAAGRLVPVKHFTLILRAMAPLIETYPHVKLRLVGSGLEEKKLRKVARELKLEAHVLFVPWAPSLASEMEKADIFALSSNHEGYGLVLAEAMAAGLPVVTTDVGCAGELVRDGEHGRIVPVRDVAAFRDALEELITDSAKRRTYGEHARATVRENAYIDEAEYVDRWVASLARCRE